MKGRISRKHDHLISPSVMASSKSCYNFYIYFSCVYIYIYILYILYLYICIYVYHIEGAVFTTISCSMYKVQSVDSRNAEKGKTIYLLLLVSCEGTRQTDYNLLLQTFRLVRASSVIMQTTRLTSVYRQ